MTDDILTDRLTVTVDEAAKLLGIGRSAAYAAARNGDLPSFRVGNLYRIPTAKLQELLANPSGWPPPKPEQEIKLDSQASDHKAKLAAARKTIKKIDKLIKQAMEQLADG